MRRSYQYRLYPTARQLVLLNQMLYDHCQLYNAALQERREAYGKAKVSVSYVGQAAQLKDIRSSDDDQARWSAASQQQTLRRLDKAFKAFFKRVKLGQSPGYPRFKSHVRFDTVSFVYGDGSKLEADGSRVKIRGVGSIKVKYHRLHRGVVKQVSVTRKGKFFYVTLVCDEVPKQVRPETGKQVGIDKGVTKLLAISDGTFIENPKHYRSREDELATAQQDLAKRKRGSKNRARAAARVGRIHRKIANSRKDALHKTSRTLIDKYDFIAVEKLNIKGMTRSAKGTVDQPGVNVAAKSGLNKSILDAGWGVCLVDFSLFF